MIIKAQIDTAIKRVNQYPESLYRCFLFVYDTQLSLVFTTNFFRTKLNRRAYAASGRHILASAAIPKLIPYGFDSPHKGRRSKHMLMNAIFDFERVLCKSVAGIN